MEIIVEQPLIKKVYLSKPNIYRGKFLANMGIFFGILLFLLLSHFNAFRWDFLIAITLVEVIRAIFKRQLGYLLFPAGYILCYLISFIHCYLAYLAFGVWMITWGYLDYRSKRDAGVIRITDQEIIIDCLMGHVRNIQIAEIREVYFSSINPNYWVIKLQKYNTVTVPLALVRDEDREELKNALLALNPQIHTQV